MVWEERNGRRLKGLMKGKRKEKEKDDKLPVLLFSRGVYV